MIRILFNFKALFFLFIALVILQEADAQRRYGRYRRNTGIEFMHDIGGSYMLSISDYVTIGAPAFTYHPRFNFGNVRESSLSLSIPASIALQINKEDNSLGSSRSSSIIYEIPIVMDWNFGHAATLRSRNGAGGYIGIGYAWNSMYAASTSSLLGSSESSARIKGIYGNAGMRFITRKDRSLGFGVYAIAGKENNRIYGLRGFWTFW